MKPEEYNRLPNRDSKPITVFRKEVMYDINSLPFYTSDENYEAAVKSVQEVYTKTGILLYDSSKGSAPVFTEKELKR